LEKKEPAKCVLQIFSGRRNPEWDLSATQWKRFLEIWDAAGASDQKIENISKLGYTGFHLTIQNQHWHVYNGQASLVSGAVRLYKSDPGKEMEKFLLKTAPKEFQVLVQNEI
jgi:hypothetical protein